MRSFDLPASLALDDAALAEPAAPPDASGLEDDLNLQKPLGLFPAMAEARTGCERSVREEWGKNNNRTAASDSCA